VISRAHRRPARVLGVVALTAPLAAVLVAGSATPALAASGSITAPASNTVYADPSVTTTTASASVTLSKGQNATLTVTGPGLGGGINSSAAYSCSSLVCPSTQDKTISVKVPLSASTANGEFTATLSGYVSGSRHFYTNYKPQADAANLAAAANGRTEVDLSWSYSAGDAAGFEVVETQDGSSRTLSVPASACSGSSCGYAISYPAPAEGATEDFSYTVTALRAACDNASVCGDYTRSATSSSATAQLVGPPPPPSPTPTPSSGGGTTGGTTGSTTTTGGTTGSGSGTTGGTSSTTGGTTGSHSSGSGTTGSASKPIVIPTLPPLVASRRAFALGFNNFSPSLGIPKLPPLPATKFPVTAAGSEAYNPTLPYTAQPRKTTSVLSSPIAAITDSIDTAQLARSLAVALILLAAAAHVRLFLSHGAED